ncbi:hypothetical protein ACFL23_03080 [Patescibacteria group bacterium]
MPIILIIILLNLLFFHSTTVGIIFSALYFIFYGKKIGKCIFPDESKIWHIFSGIFFILSFFSLFGAIIYYFYQLNNFIITILLISSHFIIHWIDRYSDNRLGQKCIKSTGQFSNDKKSRKSTGLINILLSTAYLTILGILFTILYKFSTTEAIRSPWHIILNYFFIFYILATLLLINIILKQKSRFSLLFIMLHTFFTFSIALIIYKLGYGFDPFIHQATEKVILQNGFITPKPLYYLGQYSLVVFLAKTFQSGIKNIDTFLVPVLFSVYIPSFIYLCLKSILHDSQTKLNAIKESAVKKNNSYILLATLALLILPLSSFISTTPQALANIYAIIVIFLSFYVNLQPGVLNYILIFLTATAFLIHPLTGIPLIIFLILFFISKRKIKFKKTVITLISIISAIALPIIFIINSLISNASKIKLQLNSITLSSIINLNIFNSERQYNMIRDFVYLYGFNIVPIFLIISGIGIVICKISKYQETQIPPPTPPLLRGGGREKSSHY